jgi:hypothetical protein
VELRFQKSAEELPVLRRVPDVQDFNGVVFHAVGDDVWQPPVQQFTGAFRFFASLFRFVDLPAALNLR